MHAHMHAGMANKATLLQPWQGCLGCPWRTSQEQWPLIVVKVRCQGQPSRMHLLMEGGEQTRKPRGKVCARQVYVGRTVTLLKTEPQDMLHYEIP